MSKKIIEIKEELFSARIQCFLLSIVVSLIIFLFLGIKGYIYMIIGFILAYIFLYYYLVFPKEKELRVFYKKNQFIHSLEKIFDDVIYMPESDGLISEIQKTGIFDNRNIEGNDYIKGKYDGNCFSYMDVIVDKQQVNDIETYFFKGKWMIFDLKKDNSLEMLLTPKSHKSNKNKVELEDEEFNLMCNIYSLDEHSVFYILTPSFIEKIKRIYKKNFNCAYFYLNGNKLHVGIGTVYDSFEYVTQTNDDKLNKKILNNYVLDEMKMVVGIIDYLNSNRKVV